MRLVRLRHVSQFLIVTPCWLWAPPALAQKAPSLDETTKLEIASIEQKVDPRHSDLPSEAAQARIKTRLDALALHIAASFSHPPFDLSGFVTSNAVASQLHRASCPARAYGPISIVRCRGATGMPASTVSPADALTELLAPFQSCTSLRVSFDVVSITLSDAHTAATDVAYAAFGTGQNLRLQQRATWAVNWRLGDGAERTVITRLSVRRLEQSQCQAPLFVDSTRGVVTHDDDWSPHLALGSDYWYGRLDAIGVPNLYGHEGIAIGDVNGDGRDDLYVGLGEGLPNKLLVQQADGTVRDTAHEAGVDWLDATKGVLLVDIDNDADEDLLCAIGPTIVICRNDGHGHFEPAMSLKAPTAAPFYSLSAADYDLDGDLDIYATRYLEGRYASTIPSPLHYAANGPTNHLLRNDLERGFADVTASVGMDPFNNRDSLSAAWSDYDNDGDPDVFVANDFGPGNLFRNDNGRFVEVSTASGANATAAATGACWSDIDLDGNSDLFISGIFSAAGRRVSEQEGFLAECKDRIRTAVRRYGAGNALLCNATAGDGRVLQDVADIAGVRVSGWSWGGRFVDIDNDGLDDLAIPNGFVTAGKGPNLESFFWRYIAANCLDEDEPGETDTSTSAYQVGWLALDEMIRRGGTIAGQQRNGCYLNLGDRTFADVSAIAGMDLQDDGRAAVVTDWDADGDLDIWFKNRTGPQLRFMRNEGTAGGHFVAFKLVGKQCNRDAIGAKMTLESGGRKLTRESFAGDGYLSQSSKWLHFGLGDSAAIEKVEVRWPGGAAEVLAGISADRRYRIRQQETGPALVETLGPRTCAIAARPADSGLIPTTSRIVLKEPLPMPPSVTSVGFPGGDLGRPVLLVPWMVSSEPSLAGILDLAGHQSALASNGLDVVALNTDDAATRASADAALVRHFGTNGPPSMLRCAHASDGLNATLQVVVNHIRDRLDYPVLPMSMLIDGKGMLQILYLGNPAISQLLEDCDKYAKTACPAHQRYSFAGRWYFRTHRDLATLARDLREHGQLSDAVTYSDLAIRRYWSLPGDR